MRELDTNHIDPRWELPSQADHMTMRQTLGYLVWLGRLPETALRSIVSRLRFKSDIRKMLIETSRLNQILPTLVNTSPSNIVHAFESAPHLAIYAVYLANPQEALRTIVRKYVDHWSNVEPHTTGNDLRKLGLKPSPAYGRILSSLRDAWLDGEVDTAEEEEALLSKLISEIG
ncbi:MAG: hypothetical protein P8169_08545 [Chloroflexota bacterium]